MKKRFDQLVHTEAYFLIMIWLIIGAAPVFLSMHEHKIIWQDVTHAWLALFPFLILFIINHFILVPYLLFRKLRMAYVLSVLALIIGFSLITWIEGDKQFQPPMNERFQPPVHQQFSPRLEPMQNPPRPKNPLGFPPLLITIIVTVLIIGFDTGIRMMSRWMKLEQEKSLLEKENVENQLAFLRNQVSPHFFMNTLNNIHALIDIDTEEAKNAVIKLSKLMRHILYDSENSQISIQKEVDFIVHYIDLMKLRFSDKVKIDLSIPEKLPDKSIPPLLFTSFVENAFKYGISYHSESFVSIMIQANADHLHIDISNSNHASLQQKSGKGIGIANATTRLKLLYKDDYNLNISEDDKIYKVHLSIPI